MKATERLRLDVVVVDVLGAAAQWDRGCSPSSGGQPADQDRFLEHASRGRLCVRSSSGRRGSAYVLKSSVGIEMLAALRRVARGKTYLTPSIDQVALNVQMKREPRALGAIADLDIPAAPKCCNWSPKDTLHKEIAEILHVSPRTVEFHRYRLMETLGLHTIAELVQYAMIHRVISGK